jgi:hypothetical protein
VVSLLTKLGVNSLESVLLARGHSQLQLRKAANAAASVSTIVSMVAFTQVPWLHSALSTSVDNRKHPL